MSKLNDHMTAPDEIEGCSICPRCDAPAVRTLPRVTDDHAAWCECSRCGHIWVNRHITPNMLHFELYGRH
jgi:uncharacterized paraquat-inducible protein A